MKKSFRCRGNLYIYRKKAARLSEGSEKNNFEASLTILAGIIASPYAIDKDHEMLGISIKSKESE